MPRGPRLDAPSVLHHGMVREIERAALVRDKRDRADVVDRVAARAAQSWRVVAWALLPNHADLLVRTGRHPPGGVHALAAHRVRRGPQQLSLFSRRSD